MGPAVGGDGLVGEGVSLEDHAVPAPGVAVSRVGAEVRLERGDALADGGLGAVETGSGDLLGGEGGSGEEYQEDRRDDVASGECRPEGRRTDSRLGQHCASHRQWPSPRTSVTTWLAAAPAKLSTRPSGQTTSKLSTASAAPRPRWAVAGPAER